MLLTGGAALGVFGWFGGFGTLGLLQGDDLGVLGSRGGGPGKVGGVDLAGG
jgi:hypothetical protein